MLRSGRHPIQRHPSHPRSRAARSFLASAESLELRKLLTTLQLEAGATTSGLVDAIAEIQDQPGPNTLILPADTTFSFDAVQNYYFGPNYLPIIGSNLTIQGNGSTFVASGATQARFFVVSGGFVSGGPPVGSLTLQGLTLQGGIAQGGSSTFGGGGAGMGGAIFNMGTLNLSGVTLTGNQALGGASLGNNEEATIRSGYGGGGMGTDAIGTSGGGNMGPNYPNPNGTLLGGAGGSGSRGGGGGGGFSAPGGAANGDTGGNGGGTSWLGGRGGVYTGGAYYGAGGDGGGGAGSSAIGGVGGNAFGGGGNKTGGGGVGGGGGGQSGGGGFGGGGGATGVTGPGASTAGQGGFGGGGGGADTDGHAMAGDSSFGGGVGGDFNGGGGAGMGGAVFNLYGTVNISTSTFSGNSAIGGAVGGNSGFSNGATPGQGLGGAIFNLNGTVISTQGTLSGDMAPDGGAEIYSLSFGNPSPSESANTLSAQATSGQGTRVAKVVLSNSILAGAGNVLTSNNLGGSASVEARGANIVTSYRALHGATRTGPAFISRAPRLGALKDNGGLVPTMALLKGSPAINAGKTQAGTGSGTDARGVGFNRVINRKVDLGAYEYQPPATSTRLVVKGGQGTPAALVARVRGIAAGSNAVSGTVQLVMDKQVIGSLPLQSGEAEFTLTDSILTRLTRKVRAVFRGHADGDYTLGRSESASVRVRV